MIVRSLALIVLLSSPVWSEEPPANPPARTVRVFDLHSEALQKIVRDTASTQYAAVTVTEPPRVERNPNEIKFVPPEKPAPPARQAARPVPAQSRKPDGVVNSVIRTVVSEVLGVDPAGDVDASNAMLRCQTEKEIKSTPPGPNSCAK